MVAIVKHPRNDMLLFEGLTAENRLGHDEQTRLKRRFSMCGFVELGKGGEMGFTQKDGGSVSVINTGQQHEQIVARHILPLEGTGTTKVNENIAVASVKDKWGRLRSFVFSMSAGEDLQRNLGESGEFDPKEISGIKGEGHRQKSLNTDRMREVKEQAIALGGKLTRTLEKAENLEIMCMQDRAGEAIGKSLMSIDGNRFRGLKVEDGYMMVEERPGSGEVRRLFSRGVFVLDEGSEFSGEDHLKLIDSNARILVDIDRILGRPVQNIVSTAQGAPAKYLAGVHDACELIPESHRSLDSITEVRLYEAPSTELIGKYSMGRLSLKAYLQGDEVVAGFLHEYGHAFQHNFAPREGDEFNEFSKVFIELRSRVGKEDLFAGRFGEFTKERPRMFGSDAGEFYAELYKNHVMGEGAELEKHIDGMDDKAAGEIYKRLSEYMKAKIKEPNLRPGI